MVLYPKYTNDNKLCRAYKVLRFCLINLKKSIYIYVHDINIVEKHSLQIYFS